MKRAFVRTMTIGLCVVFLTSCGTSSQHGDPSSTLADVAKTLRFVVSEALDPEILAAADTFADDVERLSGGALTVEVVTGETDATSISDGKTDFLFLDNIELANLNQDFLFFSLPFLYDGPSHMSIALNSDEMIAEAQNRLMPEGVTPLLALYNGSTCLVTNGKEIRVPADFKGLNIAMRMEYTDRMTAFFLLGAQVLPYSSEVIPEVFGTEVQMQVENRVELVTLEAAEVSLEQAAALSKRPEMRCLINTWHGLSPLWLVADADVMEQLTDWERAILAEACAGLLSELEQNRIKDEQKILEDIGREGIEQIEIERPQISSAIYNREVSGDAIGAVPDYFDRRLYNLIQTYSAYS